MRKKVITIVFIIALLVSSGAVYAIDTTGLGDRILKMCFALLEGGSGSGANSVTGGWRSESVICGYHKDKSPMRKNTCAAGSDKTCTATACQ